MKNLETFVQTGIKSAMIFWRETWIIVQLLLKKYVPTWKCFYLGTNNSLQNRPNFFLLFLSEERPSRVVSLPNVIWQVCWFGFLKIRHKMPITVTTCLYFWEFIFCKFFILFVSLHHSGKSPDDGFFAHSHFLQWISLKGPTTRAVGWRELHLSGFLNNNWTS